MTENNKKDDDREVVSDVPLEAFEEALKAVERIEAAVKSGSLKTEGVRQQPEPGSDEGGQTIAKGKNSNEINGLNDFNRLMNELSEQLSQEREGLEITLEEVSERGSAESGDAAAGRAEEDRRAAGAPGGQRRQDEESAQSFAELLNIKEGQLLELSERLKRIQAEFENYRKRMNREREEAKKFYNEELMLQLLPIVDNLERAFQHASDLEDKQALQDGVELIMNQLGNMVSGFGLEPVNTVGQLFDPSQQEAMVMVENIDAKPGMVLSEYQRGYLLHGRLLRPAQVVVARAPGATSAPSAIDGSPPKANHEPKIPAGGSGDTEERNKIRVSNDSKKG